MIRTAKLTYTSNPSLQEYIGQVGEISRNAHGGYDFKMLENGQTIRTSAAKPNTTLGDVNHPGCKNIGFQTNSGTMYQFDFNDVERLVDGVRKDGNHFLGFEHDFKIGDEVYNNAGHKGKILSYNPATELYFVEYEVKSGDAFARYCNSFASHELRPVGLSDRINDVRQRASELNENHKDNSKDSFDMGLGY